MKRVLCLIGTRPEGIKMAPVVRALAARPAQFEVITCSTGQHREMLAPVLDLFAIRVDHDLQLMTANQQLAGLTALLLQSIDRLVREEKPDWILAQGDTTTVLAASMIAFYTGTAFGHVEAGLRTGDFQHPFPEEFNRRVADLVAAAWFAPTELAADNLRREGCDPTRVHVTGNTVIDALHAASAMPFDASSGPLASLDPQRPVVLITAHRRESFGAPFRELCEAIRELADRFPDRQFVYPVHLNPNVQEPVRAILSGARNLLLLPPLDYLSLVHLMKRSQLVLTDSGGIQEEAPGLGVPVVVMRNTTERPEGVTAGVVRLAGNGREGILREAGELLQSAEARAAMSRAVNPYGDGRAAERIAELLARP